MSASDRRLIEEALPLKEISFEAAREKSIRHGHISTLHIWWARRPLVACRAAVLGSLIRDPGDERERRSLVDFLVRFCKWEASNDPELKSKARTLVISSNKGEAPKVLDCFAGGGAIPLEALRVGCDTTALELNPVAVLIELCSLVYPQKYGNSFEIRTHQRNMEGEAKTTIPNRLAYDVERWGKWVLTEARKEIAQFYPADPDGKIPVAYIWARTVKCQNPACAADVPLVRQLWLSKADNVSLRISVRKRERRVRFEIAEGKRIDFDPNVGTMRMGSVECPICKHAAKGTYLRSEASANRFGQKLMAVVLTSEKTSGKYFRTANQADETTFDMARQAIARKTRETKKSTGQDVWRFIPNEPIPRPEVGSRPGQLDPFYVHMQIVNYGMSTFGDLFNERQRLSLGTFAEKVREIYSRILAECGDEEYAKAVTTYLAFLVDRLADRNSALCFWNSSRLHTSNTFGRQVLQMAWDYAEINPLAGSSGNFGDSVKWISDVIENNPPFSNSSRVRVVQGTATRLPFADAEFDSIVTDPPYYDAVPYSDLSDFFYVWLKRTVGDLYPHLFSTPLSIKGPEIIQNSSLLRRVQNSLPNSSHGQIKDRLFFEQEMTKALQEMNRVLKPHGICTVVFAHKTMSAWESLIDALLRAGLTVVSSWPLHTERPGRLRAFESAALASSVWLVCRKRSPNAGVGSWKRIQAELDERVKNRLNLFLEEGVKGADALLSAIGPALEVFGRYLRVEKVTGEQVTIAEFLDKVREAVAHHALSTVLSEHELGNVDPPTAFYVLWKWTFEPAVQNGKLADSSSKSKGNGNHILVPYDDALKLARSVGADPEVLLKTHIMKQEKENVRLLGPNERKHISGLGETARDGMPPATIDMIHRALNLWAAMEHSQLEEYLEKSGAKNNETFWRVAQALSNLLPLQSREKQLLDGLLARHAGGAEDVRPREVRSLDEFVKKEEK
jgi:adenine-specific DNA methylase